MTLSPLQEKREKIKTQCKELLQNSLVMVRELSNLIGCLSSLSVAVPPVPLEYRALQHRQTQGIISKGIFEGQLRDN